MAMGSSKGGGGNDAMRFSGRVSDTSDAGLDDIFDPFEGEPADEDAPTRVVLSEELLLRDLDKPSGTQGLEASPANQAAPMAATTTPPGGGVRRPPGNAPVAKAPRGAAPAAPPTAGPPLRPPEAAALPPAPAAAALPPVPAAAALPPLAPP